MLTPTSSKAVHSHKGTFDKVGLQRERSSNQNSASATPISSNATYNHRGTFDKTKKNCKYRYAKNLWGNNQDNLCRK